MENVNVIVKSIVCAKKNNRILAHVFQRIVGS